MSINRTNTLYYLQTTASLQEQVSQLINEALSRQAGRKCNCGNKVVYVPIPFPVQTKPTSQTPAPVQTTPNPQTSAPAQTTPAPQDQVKVQKPNTETVEDGKKVFETIDANGNDKITKDEFVTAYLRDAERKLGKQLKKGSPDYKKYEAEAENIFKTLREYNNWFSSGRISKKRYEQYLKYLDRADGSLDGKYDKDFEAEILEKIKDEGKDAEVSAGKTLRELLDLEA